MINARLVQDPYSKNQSSDKLKHNRLGPFRILELIDRSALCLDLPGHSRIHLVVNISHTSLYLAQPSDIRKPLALPLPSVHSDYSDEYEPEYILAHRHSETVISF